MAVNKEHKEFHQVDPEHRLGDADWLSRGHPAKNSSGGLDENAKRGTRSRLPIAQSWGDRGRLTAYGPSHSAERNCVRPCEVHYLAVVPGQTKSQITRHKPVKRQICGRGKFDLQEARTNRTSPRRPCLISASQPKLEADSKNDQSQGLKFDPVAIRWRHGP
jgi:hypothetical protein